MAKRRSKVEELVPGVPMREALEFLCRQSGALALKDEYERDQKEDDRFMFFLDFGDRHPIAVPAMIARGWIVEAPSRQRNAKMRYRLTEAGRRLGRDSAHLFKWPASESRIAPPSEHAGWLRCLMHLHSELGHHGIAIDDLASHQKMILRELGEGLSEPSLAAMHAYWNYNAQRVGWSGERTGNPRRPRIELRMYFNNKDTFIVEWEPAGLDWKKDPTADCDWVYWRDPVEPHGHNELLSIRELRYARRHFPGMFNEAWTRPEGVMVDAILLQATSGLMDDLKRRLALTFDVHTLTDIEASFEDVPTKQPTHRPKQVLATWTLIDVERRRKQSDLAELERFPTEMGCPMEIFANAVKEAETKRPTVPSPSTSSKDERISRSLKRAGYNKLTPSVVRRYRVMLEERRPDLFPPLPKPRSTSSVVPFRRTNGNGGTKPH